MLKRFSSDARLKAKYLRQSVLADPYHRFATLLEVQQAAELGIRIDVNKAGVDDWLRLPGFSIHQARMLVQLTQGGVQFYGIEDVAAALGLPTQRLIPLEAILLFCYYEPESPYAPQRVNPNTASVEQLQQIPGMMPSLARTMIRDRVTQGPYQNLADLQQRLSLSGAVIQHLLPYLQF